MKYLTQTEFADIAGISQQMVSRHIRNGAIRPSSLKKISGKTRIIEDKALEDLQQNLSIHHREKAQKVKMNKQKTQDILNQALEFANAATGEEIVQTLRYIAKLHELAPEMIRIQLPVDTGMGHIGLTYPEIADADEDPFQMTLLIDFVEDDE